MEIKLKVYRKYSFIAGLKDIVCNYWNFLLEILQCEVFFTHILIHDLRMDWSSKRIPNKVNYF